LLSVGVLAGLVVLMVGVGSFLPRSRTASRSLRSNHSPEDVWRVITDYRTVPTWHGQVKRVERLPDRNGQEVWRELHRGGAPLQLVTTETVPYRRLVRAILDEKKVFSGRWEFDLEPESGGCRLTITEHGEVANPFFRFLWHLGNPAMYVEMYLKALAKKLGEEAVLEARS
jgi:uncharacterized protein YndB with AHSA1/START domain